MGSFAADNGDPAARPLDPRDPTGLRDRDQMRFRLALEAARAGAWEWEIGSNRTYWSPENYHLMGLPPGSGWATYGEWMERVHPDDRARAETIVAAAIERRGDLDFAYRVVWPDGTVRWLRDVGRMMLADDGTPIGMYGIQIDITEQQSLNDRLRQAERMEAMGRVAGMVAHDFNNLLTVIGGNGELLEGDPALDDGHRILVRELCDAATRAGSLTRQLLAFGRGQLFQAQVIDLNRLITRRKQLLLGTIGENIRATIRQAPDLPCVRADPGQIEQVLLNLVMNARDAMPRGGTLGLETFVEDGARPEPHGSATPERWVGVRIRDSGTGMDAETLERVFDPFFTTKPAGRGTGLGLASVHGIITQSGGRVAVTSVPEVGTTFTFYLPAVADTERVAEPDPVRHESVHGAEVLLVVEDEPGIRNLLGRRLRKLGYTVLTAASAEEALDLASGRQPPVEVLVTDVVLPGMDGPALSDRLREDHPGLRVVFMTGYGQDSLGQRAVPVTDAVLHKPFTLEAVAREVRRAIDSVRGVGRARQDPAR